MPRTYATTYVPDFSHGMQSHHRRQFSARGIDALKGKYVLAIAGHFKAQRGVIKSDIDEETVWVDFDARIGTKEAVRMKKNALVYVNFCICSSAKLNNF